MLKFRIVRSPLGGISIGIIDYSKQKKLKSVSLSEDSILYKCENKKNMIWHPSQNPSQNTYQNNSLFGSSNKNQ